MIFFWKCIHLLVHIFYQIPFLQLFFSHRTFTCLPKGTKERIHERNAQHFSYERKGKTYLFPYTSNTARIVAITHKTPVLSIFQLVDVEQFSMNEF